MESLQNAAYCYATAIKQKSSDASSHFQLAKVLEEKYYTSDLHGIKDEVVQ